ncbi:prepilin-type N-terminal cleavage/methylation domain-containing protein [Gemmata sp. JC717]|uniref:type II secretion system protein n=1 Tax=Gemmata algarum TaxID=2975278 RepID=UPI0021BAA60E|nr:prepilin-type N-terminal cleavage/methylation domain-containing protein [Gemmata algarum]MDY3552350.1 prepilin-type N-terminal cleavage/methylation domain-containing protein [Gemmata algarum]
MHTNTLARGRSARQAFTLIELLVVISIIGLLTGLIVAGTMKFKDVSRVNAADAQVTKYQQALEAEYNFVVQKCHKEGPPDLVITYCGGNVERAKAVHTAASLRINFPETFAEAEAAASFSINGYQYNVKNTFASVRGIASATPASTTSIPTANEQKAILLYLIVKEKATAGTGNDTDASGEYRTVTFGTKSLTLIIDSFGSPLVYNRWARGGELENPPYVAQSSATTKDPLDPRGLVSAWSGLSSLNTIADLGFNNQNRLPTVVSSGRNKIFENFGGDDRVGYRLSRFGAKGDQK